MRRGLCHSFSLFLYSMAGGFAFSLLLYALCCTHFLMPASWAERTNCAVQVFTLVAMEPPVRVSGPGSADYVRDAKASSLFSQRGRF